MNIFPRKGKLAEGKRRNESTESTKAVKKVEVEHTPCSTSTRVSEGGYIAWDALAVSQGVSSGEGSGHSPNIRDMFASIQTKLKKSKLRNRLLQQATKGGAGETVSVTNTHSLQHVADMADVAECPQPGTVPVAAYVAGSNTPGESQSMGGTISPSTQPTTQTETACTLSTSVPGDGPTTDAKTALINLGFPPDLARRAMSAFPNDINRAADWILAGNW
jgi:hypothetical protein